MQMPNIHYFTVNMAPFGMSNKDEVSVLFFLAVFRASVTDIVSYYIKVVRKYTYFEIMII